MSDLLTDTSSRGLLSENILHFARVLRRAGLPVGPGQVLVGLRAVLKIGLSNRDDFYWALHAVFVKRLAQREIFDQAFYVFWRNPEILERMTQLIFPDISDTTNTSSKSEDVLRRVTEAFSSNSSNGEERVEEEMEFDASLTWSSNELFGSKDFEKMSNEEVQLAISAVRRIKLPQNLIQTRRFKMSNIGKRIDMRRTMRAVFRSGADFMPLIKRERQKRRPPLIILCDISGSMECYSRMLLHFMHAVTNDRDRVHTFLFGTCLTNVTRYLRYKDVDQALGKVGEAATDWSGGTRIGQSLSDFNKLWSRRVLTQEAVVLFISDGLDRGEANDLSVEIQRLHRSCRRLIWLNPLLRYEGFEPKSIGIKTILPHVDDFKTIHNLNSIEKLVHILNADVKHYIS